MYIYVHVSNPRTLMPLHPPSHPSTLSLTPSHPPHIPLLTLLHFLTPSLLTHPLHTLPTLTPFPPHTLPPHPSPPHTLPTLTPSLHSHPPSSHPPSSQCVAYIVAAELPAGQWPDIIAGLLLNVSGTSNTEAVKEASLEAIGYICEELVSCDFQLNPYTTTPLN